MGIGTVKSLPACARIISFAAWIDAFENEEWLESCIGLLNALPDVPYAHDTDDVFARLLYLIDYVPQWFEWKHKKPKEGSLDAEIKLPLIHAIFHAFVRIVVMSDIEYGWRSSHLQDVFKKVIDIVLNHPSIKVLVQEPDKEPDFELFKKFASTLGWFLINKGIDNKEKELGKLMVNKLAYSNDQKIRA